MYICHLRNQKVFLNPVWISRFSVLRLHRPKIIPTSTRIPLGSWMSTFTNLSSPFTSFWGYRIMTFFFLYIKYSIQITLFAVDYDRKNQSLVTSGLRNPWVVQRYSRLGCVTWVKSQSTPNYTENQRRDRQRPNVKRGFGTRSSDR